MQKKRSLWYCYRAALIVFAIAMSVFAVTFFLVGQPWYIIVAVGATGGTIGSFSIAIFFAMQYIMPSQIAANEMVETGRNNGSMYFAVQGLAVQVISGIAAFVYLNVKQLHVFGRDEYGIALIPPLVAVMCIVGVVLSFVIRGAVGKENKKAS
jgi:Na+/melibiose symporter-like transporter